MRIDWTGAEVKSGGSSVFRCEPGPSGHRGSECGRLSVGGGKEGKDICNGTGFQLQQKPLRLNASTT